MTSQKFTLLDYFILLKFWTPLSNDFTYTVHKITPTVSQIITKTHPRGTEKITPYH